MIVSTLLADVGSLQQTPRKEKTMTIDVDEGYEDSYTRDGVKLVVEDTEGSLVITYADLNPEDTYHLVILLVDRLAAMVGQTYNGVLKDIRDDEEESE